MSAQFTVWTRPIDDDADWTEELSTDDLSEAEGLAHQLGVGDVIATIYERGRFKVDGRRRTDSILFWWSANYNDAMEGEPTGRGQGWPENHAELVSYEPATRRALTVARHSREVDVEAAEPEPRYGTFECAGCLQIHSKQHATAQTRSVEVGRSSGSTRWTSSWSSGSSSRSSSSRSSSSYSSSSGRKYYKTQTVLFCEECVEKQRIKDAESVRLMRRFIVFCVVIVLIFYIASKLRYSV